MSLRHDGDKVFIKEGTRYLGVICGVERAEKLIGAESGVLYDAGGKMVAILHCVEEVERCKLS